MKLDGSIIRFVVTGIANTLLSIVIYELALNFMRADLAYALSWSIGIFVVSVITPTFVFRTKATLGASGRVIILYLTSFGVGFALTDLLVVLGVPERLVILAVVAVTASMNYAGGRMLLQSPDRKTP